MSLEMKHPVSAVVVAVTSVAVTVGATVAVVVGATVVVAVIALTKPDCHL